MLHPASRTQYKWMCRRRLLWKRLPLRADQFRPAVRRREAPVGIEPRRGRSTFRRRPLRCATLRQRFIANPGVVAQPPLRDASPIPKRILDGAPAREQLFPATQLLRDAQENVEIGTRFALG